MGEGIALGNRVEDTVSGYEGVVTAIATYLHGTPRAEVTRHASITDNDDTTRWFDVGRLKVLAT